MRTLILSGTALLAATVGALAQGAGPVGEWLVKDGTTRIKVVSCPDGPDQPPALWGVIWAETDPGVDDKNPEPSMRSRPTLGIPILVDMKQAEANLWNGKIYDPTRGSLWTAKLSLSRTDMLEVRGCLTRFLCMGEDWKRVTGTDTPPVHQAAAPGKGGTMSPQPQAKGGTMAKAGTMSKGGGPPPVDPICSNVASLAPRG